MALEMLFRKKITPAAPNGPIPGYIDASTARTEKEGDTVVTPGSLLTDPEALKIPVRSVHGFTVSLKI
jgi:hypothetical protein